MYKVSHNLVTKIERTKRMERFNLHTLYFSLRKEIIRSPESRIRYQMNTHFGL